MPTYSYRCAKCGAFEDHFRTMGDYLHNPKPFFCCAQQMDRAITVAPGLALHNALASERHYDGLRASDGSDISSRAKHRAYMKAHGLTTADDFKNEWATAAKHRADIRAGIDPTRRADLERVFHEHVNKG